MIRFLLLVSLLALVSASLPAQEGDRVTLEDGSVVHGEVLSLVDGKLEVSTVFSGTVLIEMSKVSRLVISRVLPFTLEDGSAYRGTVASPAEGRIELSVEGTGKVIRLDLANVVSINPAEPGKKSSTKGAVNFGGGAADGNTQTRSASFNADLEGRLEDQRLSVGLAYNYAEDHDGPTARNSRGRWKYDYFFSEPFFVFGSVLLEEDSFQDLNLRAAISGGPGHQFVEKGDLKGEYLKGLSAYGEIGLSYVDENFIQAEDNSYLAAKWALNMDWKILPKLSLFHHQEGYPGIADLENFYVTTETGIRVAIYENFVSTLQVNWRWDNSPSPGFGRSDTNYMMTFGYTFGF